MVRMISILLVLATTLFGGLLDFRTLPKAAEAYAYDRFDEAAELYESIENKDDDLHYNLGNVYYKQNKYEKALGEYEQVSKEELKAKTLHNMGNTYYKMGQNDKAISSYKEALKLKEDEDTRKNLELAKKKKEEEQKKEEQNEPGKDGKPDTSDNNKTGKEDPNGEQQGQKKDQDGQNKKDQKKDQNGDDAKQQNQDKNGDAKDDQQKKDQQEKEKREQQAKEEQKRDEEQSKEKQGEMKEGDAKEDPISAMQERKYEKMLDKRGIKTLMVPLKTEGAPHEETTAW